MATINISIHEFRGFVFDDLPHYYEETTVGGERAFETKLGKEYTLQILTSIPVNEEEVRKEGDDAIRVQIVNPEGTPVRAETHTKRTPGYQERVSEKIISLIRCPECRSSELRVSEGQYGPYFFCTSDNCSYTDSIEST